MDFKILEYMISIEKHGTMAGAASEHFITSSALNQQLLKLEGELGVPLFIRTKRRLVPTAAGNIYLRGAKKILNCWQAIHSELQDLADCMTGSYRIGLPYEHGSDVFTRIYPDFQQQYPKIQIQCYQLLAPELLEMLISGDLEIALLLTGNPDAWNDIDYLPLSSENVLLGLPKGHPLAVGANLSAINPAPDLRQLENDRFALSLKRATMRTEVIDPLFEAVGFKPTIMIESSFNSFLQQLTAAGICNTIIPQSQVRNYHDIVWFYLPGTPRFHFVMGYIKGYRLNAALRYFFDMAKADAMEHLNFAKPNVQLNH